MFPHILTRAHSRPPRRAHTRPRTHRRSTVKSAVSGADRGNETGNGRLCAAASDAGLTVSGQECYQPRFHKLCTSCEAFSSLCCHRCDPCKQSTSQTVAERRKQERWRPLRSVVWLALKHLIVSTALKYSDNRSHFTDDFRNKSIYCGDWVKLVLNQIRFD